MFDDVVVLVDGVPVNEDDSESLVVLADCESSGGLPKPYT